MNNFKRLFIFIIIASLFTCKEYNLDSYSPENSFRIKTIIEFDDLGEEQSRDVFNYKEGKLILWQLFYKNENNQFANTRKIEVIYLDENMIATLFNKKNNEWIPQQQCNYTVSENLIHQKLVSRLVFPTCDECWKYTYKYDNLKLVEWNKLIKSETNEWSRIRKGVMRYKNNKLTEYKDSVNFDNTELKLDYKKTFSYKNEKVSGWLGGICADNSTWQATQRVEFTYIQENISIKTYSIWDDENNVWKFFGTTNYYYDDNNNLLEESTSNGTRKVYEYEKGLGNTSLLYCEPENFEQGEPTLKNAHLKQFIVD